MTNVCIYSEQRSIHKTEHFPFELVGNKSVTNAIVAWGFNNISQYPLTEFRILLVGFSYDSSDPDCFQHPNCVSEIVCIFTHRILCKRNPNIMRANHCSAIKLQLVRTNLNLNICYVKASRIILKIRVEILYLNFLWEHFSPYKITMI